MSTLVVPATFREMLQKLDAPAEVYDNGGRFLGHFTPATPGENRRFYEPPNLTEEEWQRIEAQPSFTGDEILASLEKL